MKTVIRLPFKESKQPEQKQVAEPKEFLERENNNFDWCSGCDAPEWCRSRNKCAKS